MLLLLLLRLQTSETYFDGIVEVLVETLSCVEAEDLDLKHREDTETEKQAEDRLQISTFNCCLCNYQRPAGGTEGRRKEDCDWLCAPPLGHQLVEEMILQSPQGLEAVVLILDWAIREGDTPPRPPPYFRDLKPQ